MPTAARIVIGKLLPSSSATSMPTSRLLAGMLAGLGPPATTALFVPL